MKWKKQTIEFLGGPADGQTETLDLPSPLPKNWIVVIRCIVDMELVPIEYQIKDTASLKAEYLCYKQ